LQRRHGAGPTRQFTLALRLRLAGRQLLAALGVGGRHVDVQRLEWRRTGVADLVPVAPLDQQERPLPQLDPLAEQLFLKPGVTKKVTKWWGFSLNYAPRANWLTYSRLLEFGGCSCKTWPI
jgi:hypothetical protein